MDNQLWLEAVRQVNSGEVLLSFWAAAVPLAISGISALSGLLANRKKQAEQTSTQTTDTTSAPQYDDKALYMRNMLMDQYLDRMRFNEDMFQGYSNEGLRQINQGNDITSRALENILASRGLSNTSAGVSSQVQNQINRGNQQASFLNSIPLLRDQRQQQNILGAGQFFSSLPYATHQTGTQRSTGTATQPGNALGGMFGSLGTTLAGLYGQGAFGNDNANGNSGSGGILPKTIDYGIVPPGYKLGG